AVHCNTNLGILLLCAPLAMAAEVPAINRTSLQARLKQILADLTDDDTRNVFQAIARATPGGLGDASEGDVRKAPRAGMTLLHAMQLAAPRDLIAVEYTTGFERIFDLAGLLDRSQQGEDWSVEDALAAAYIRLLGRVYDTHIARKHGLTKAIEVRDRAIKLQQRLSMSYERRPSHPEVHRELLAFDAELKAEGLNPGTLADLIAAAAFIHNLNTAQIA
ncbi:MAG: triphosphoribosyl-dephospho-CoA synthase, partial [Hyphomicrobium sp.]